MSEGKKLHNCGCNLKTNKVGKLHVLCDGLDVGQLAELRPQVYHYMEETRIILFIYSEDQEFRKMMIEGELQSEINHP